MKDFSNWKLENVIDLANDNSDYFDRFTRGINYVQPNFDHEAKSLVRVLEIVKNLRPGDKIEIERPIDNNVDYTIKFGIKSRHR